MATVPEISTYEAALAYLYGRINYERAAIPAYRVQNFKLERMRELMRRLGDPHLPLPVVHVAGTKGKGSTSSMLASILTAAGYRTGLYTSPHLERTEERLVVDGQVCSPEEFIDLLAVIRPVVDQIDEEGSRSTGPGCPTYFELMTDMAFMYFARRKVDAVVLEVGLGGRLDSTNIVKPVVSVITSISFDHMRQLGNTLALIAGEKAGIIKPGVPVITGVTESEPLEVIARVAREQDAPLSRANADFRFQYRACESHAAEDRLPRGRISYQGTREYVDLELGLIGDHQAANAAVALATIERLQTQGWQIDEEAIRRGLANVRCPARIEVLQTAPTVVIDTAHNAASINALLQVLTAAPGYAKRHLIFACSRDKDAAAMLAQLGPNFDTLILTRFQNNPRAIAPEELAEICTRLELESSGQSQVITVPDPPSAWTIARQLASKNDLICATGSFFLAAELRSLIIRDRSAATL